MQLTRCTATLSLITVALVATAGIGIGTTAFASTAPDDLRFTQVSGEYEYVVITNFGDTTVDLSGYVMEFEYGQQVNQTKVFPDGTTIAPGEELVVASGAEPVPNREVDVRFDYEGAVINNDGSDTMAILAPDGSVVVTEDAAPPTDTATATPTATSTQTAEELTPTESPTPTPTEEQPTTTDC